MKTKASEKAQKKLETQRNIWFGSVRPDGRPHLSPVWFVWTLERIYVSIDPASIKARNLAENRKVVVALEDGDHPVICEGWAGPAQLPYPQEIVDAFQQKYGWDILSDGQYSLLVEVKPEKWLEW